MNIKSLKIKLNPFLENDADNAQITKKIFIPCSFLDKIYNS